jgi:hypothetical protein
VNVIKSSKGWRRPGGLVGVTTAFQDPARWAAFDWLKAAVGVNANAIAAIAAEQISDQRLLVIGVLFLIVISVLI